MSQFPVHSRLAITIVVLILVAFVIRFSQVAEAVVVGDDNSSKAGKANVADAVDHPFYLPEQYFLINQGRFLTDPMDGEPLKIALEYLKANSKQFGLNATDIENAKVSSMYRDEDTGVTHIYLRQVVSGLEVSQADINIHVTSAGEVICAGGGFVQGLPTMLVNGSVSRAPSISSEEAVRHAARILGLSPASDPEVASMSANGEKSVINAPGVSIEEINAELKFVPMADGAAALSWELVIQTTDSKHWYNLNIDATTGELASLADWIKNDSYTVLALPNESLNDGFFQTVVDPFSAATNASPFGWHDTNGVLGAEFTNTRGNNVDAHLDRDANNVADPGSRPDGGALLNFNSVFNPALSPFENADASVTNMFYWNNILHDLHYQYGFTPVAGNFQTNNYGNGGAGNDAVQADGQDGSGTDNANFGAPADGIAPRMQMFEFTSTTPRRDSSMDSGVMTHEYGHGVSTRLTGGPANSNSLNATQSGGMGEGWSDFHALMFLQRPTDTANGAFPMGTYVLGQAPNGSGIRRKPYSFDMSIDPLTFDAYGTSGITSYGVARSTEVHNTGELWSSALWDLNWLLINKYGYDGDLYTGWTGSGAGGTGNKLELRLVMDAMKLQPANPSFIQARDAIFAADTTLTGGANQCEIWRAFARRGLGQTASTASSSSTAVTLSFTVPATCGLVVSSSTPAAGSVTAVPPTSFVINFSDALTPASVTAADLKINGISATSFVLSNGNQTATFSYAVSPVTIQGSQTMNIAAGAVTRASDADGNDLFNKAFRYDAVTLSVTSTTPAVNGTLTLPAPLTLDVNFNEPVAAASITTDDLTLSIGTVTGAVALDADTARYTISGIDAETVLNVSLAALKVTDAVGNPNSSFLGAYQVDISTFAYPGPLAPTNPPGSLIYDGSYSATVQFAGDSDGFTLNVDAGQMITVKITPTALTLQPSVVLRNPANAVIASGTAAGAGQNAILQNVTAASSGVYTISVGGSASTTGGYSVEVTLNSALENEGNLAGSTNETLGTAQDLSTAFTSLGTGSTRAGVRGRSESVSVSEIEPNGTTATATAFSSATSVPTGLYQLGISGTVGSGTDNDYFNVGQLQAGDVITITQSGSVSGRGTNTDTLVRLYRSGGTIEASDDDGGPGPAGGGGDSLEHRFTITVTDTYYIRAGRFAAANLGTWQLGIFLENSGSAPTTGGTFTAEVEPNENIAGANNASGAWRQVNYQFKALGSIAAGDTDIYSYQFTAGDVVTLVATSTSGLAPQSALLNSAGTAIATEDGTSDVAGAGGISPHYGYVISTTGTYYYRVTASAGTGSYSSDVYRSTAAVVPILPPSKDLYSISLSAGQSVSVALKNITAGNLDVSLLDSGGSVVATGTSGPTNVDKLISNYAASFAPEILAGTYYVQVTGGGDVDYQIVALTGAAFDAEPNDSLGAAQDISGKKGVLGQTADNDYYSFAAVAGQSIALQSTTPGDGPGEFVNSLNPKLELYDPAGVLIASGTTLVDGRNEQVSQVAASSGNYKVRVLAEGGSSGEYFLTLSLISPTAAGVSVTGRVLTVGGQGDSGARVSITDTHGSTRTVSTGSFGYFRFDNVQAGGAYVVSVRSKRYVYAPRVLSIFDEISDLDFVPIN